MRLPAGWSSHGKTTSRPHSSLSAIVAHGIDQTAFGKPGYDKQGRERDHGLVDGKASSVLNLAIQDDQLPKELC